MCSGLTQSAKIYFEDRGRIFYWDELAPNIVRKNPSGRANIDEIMEIREVLIKEKVKRRFTPEARIISKALKYLGKRHM